ncbi:PREDICTED: DNA-directed RNA polymerase I subunit RPA43 [Papilio polytes]|uniref:DNA-directed RNA polymerase I subunit RPA43 n=1 Tax=Papilio polytes TaxID=76194 RepID=UPI0006761E2A|nr:PREDICTED: DNA-directed RNA polymerase I subunit RPA43 [Papilio polytes]
MSAIIKFELKELRKLANDKNSCVVERKVTQNLALQPWCLGNLKESIKKLLDYKIGKYDKEFQGIIMSYKNLRVLQNVGTIRNDNGDIYFQVQADYFVFQPRVGATLKGIVNKKSVTHLGILVHRVFNVVIPRPTEEPGNKWIGTNIDEGQEVVFRIVVLDLYGALPYIRGELDERWIENEYDEEIMDSKPSKSKVIDVSYVDFNKTKPNVAERSIGDGCEQMIQQTKTKSLKRKDSRNKNVSVDESNQEITNGQHDDVKSVATEKSKTKRHSKHEDTVRQIETSTKGSKKQKRT